MLFSTVLLIFSAPIILPFDGTVIQAIIAAYAALSLAIVVIRIRPAEAAFFSHLAWPIASVAVVPAIWMIIQVLPFQSIAHPIWQSASAALGQSLPGSVTVDTGGTLISLVRYLSAFAIVFMTMAVAADRRRARQILYALTTAATFTSLSILAHKFGALYFLADADNLQINAAAVAIAVSGISLAVACLINAFERKKSQQPGQFNWLEIPLCFVALVVCGSAVIFDASGEVYFAALCGIFTVASALGIRRFSLGPWGIAAVVSIVLFIIIAIVVFEPSNRTLGLTIAYAVRTSPQIAAITQRIIAESSLFGTGAGTFAAITQIYQDIDGSMTADAAPTAAAVIAIEMGRPFLLASIAGTVVLVVVLFRGALRRQRDFFCPIAGAGCVATIALLSFGGTALFNTSVAITVSATIGMALAQSKSRLV